MRDAARRAFSKRVPGSSVADITFDSLLDAPEDDADRRLTFTADDVSIEITVVPADDRLNLVVSVQPPGFAESVEAVDTGETIPLGISGATVTVGKGLRSLLVRPAQPGDPLLQTAWVLL